MVEPTSDRRNVNKVTDWTSLNYVVVDVEGNGQQPPDLVELAAVPIVGGVIGEPVSWLVKPEMAIKHFATRIHGLTHKDVAECPAFADIKDDVLSTLKGAALVAHNAPTLTWMSSPACWATGRRPRCSTRSSSPGVWCRARTATDSATWSMLSSWPMGFPKDSRPTAPTTAPRMTRWSRRGCSSCSPPRHGAWKNCAATHQEGARMKLRPFSDHQRGVFVSVDGPSGAGKSTIVHHLAQLLIAAGEDAHVTAEPSTGPIGALCRELTETITGHALACLYAADRYHHLEAEVRPNTSVGRVVISDRYIPSGLVMQRFDGIDPSFLWHVNAEADRPDLVVILEADPEVIAVRLSERGPHNRFQLSPGSSHAEVRFYRQATERFDPSGLRRAQSGL